MNDYPPKLNATRALNEIIILYIAFNIGYLGLSEAKIAVPFTEDSDSFMPYNIVFEGDSLTAEGIYPKCVISMLNLDADTSVIHNAATPGQTLYPTMVTDAPHQVDAKFRGPGYHNIAVLWAGTNDLYINSGLDASILHEYIRNWCNGRKAAGFQVVVCTITPRSEYGTPGSFEEKRQALNEMIRAHYSEYADELVDIAANPHIGDANDELDTAYYYDKVHMTPSGYAIVANIVKDSIIRLTNS